MSRFDDFEGPPGFNFMRSPDALNGGTQHSSSPTGLPGYVPRGNGQTGGYPLYASSVPRSSGATDWEQQGWEVGPTGPNRSNPTTTPNASFSLYNHHHPSPPQSNPLYTLNDPRVDRAAIHDRDTYRAPQSPISVAPAPHSASANTSRSTLWWGELEPWMDEEYAKQVCSLMGWDPISIKVPHPAPDPTTGQHANNPGYCFLTFPTPTLAASVLAQVNATNSVTMPNSTKPFVLNWASSIPSNNAPVSPGFPAMNVLGTTPQYPKEYSIFVGDLAPETSNSDLVAVFRNPVLGLRNDREPKFIRPFLSCKSAKIMLDPATGVSRGYGFVRFTDESDQQRALVEMHGLYCLSRPMRISPATAKFKPTTVMPPHDLPQVQFPPTSNGNDNNGVTIAVPLPALAQAKSVSAPIAATNSHSSLHSASSGSSSSLEGSSSGTTLSSNTSASSNSLASASFNTVEDMLNLPNHVLAQIAKQYATGEREPPKQTSASTSITSQFAQERPGPNGQTQRYFSEESWKHHAQAQAILSNLIGPNGEQLTSSDPYNTTVFVGGLSPLISEETLRTFFAPFGDIHYVKVPVGKHCGFVQFVRKVDAERAIQKMQGFPVGGSRIRLSWGRSQYKAAQAAAQAAQTAALQSQLSTSLPLLTPDQLQTLQLMKLNQGNLNQSAQPVQLQHIADRDIFAAGHNHGHRHDILDFGDVDSRSKSFSPFSPEANAYARRDSYSNPSLPHPSKSFAPGFFPDDGRSSDSGNSTLKTTPTGTRPGSASRYGTFLSSSPTGHRPAGRLDGHISRPSSGNPPDKHELDAMHDLNGTLASLDLDRDRDRPWKSPAESSDSSSSVQFQMTMNTSP